MTGIMLRLGEQGRMVIPVELRKELGLEVGTELVATIEGDRLILETRKAVLSKLKNLFAVVPSDISLADELIADRRAEHE
ncbi:looped-hinge helix DNA binding domain, AbrB family [Synechococcus sp. PCC 7502]|uniref:AbrB/MazE/SpoVT family DNA-binding domain-containing protein n=1 Tax=Synechococcus sp. PCC 7502 TaxID=1173263 RepID=UPI00029FA299|nr:AbrB/MazE/SpoVT family DNA-binding domain-containing protein [Synechococcus sp. PCC 7502]AFY73507.1 looped-hinge helix DNA binding domain, AbrB family [Synechococcus sp. PCC 7502]